MLQFEMERSSCCSDPPTEPCQHDAKGNPQCCAYLIESIKRDSVEIIRMCKQSRDATSAKKLQRVYKDYDEELSALIQSLNTDNEDSPTVPENESGEHEPDSVENSLVPQKSADPYNVEAPSFIPHQPEETQRVQSQEDFDSNYDAQYLLNEQPQFNPNTWHPPTVFQSQYSVPHYHVANYPVVLVPSVQRSGVLYPSYSHYSPGWTPSQHYGTLATERPPPPLLPEWRPRQRQQHHGHRKSKVFRPPTDIITGKYDVPAGTDSAEETRDQGSVQGTDAPNIVIPTNDISDSCLTASNAPRQNNDIIKSESNVDAPITSPDNIPQDTLRDNRLGDFPELSANIRRPRSRLPRVNFQKKPKLTISDLAKKFDHSHGPSNTQSNNLLGVPSGTTDGGKLELKTEMYHKTKCCCKNQIDLCAHYPALRAEVLEAPSGSFEEGDGWKTVKSRYRHKDTVHPCKDRQPGYLKPRTSVPTRRKKPLNVVSASHFNQGRFKDRSNNNVQGAIQPQALDLHYNNVISPAHMIPKQRKVNNELTHDMQDVDADSNDRIHEGCSSPTPPAQRGTDASETSDSAKVTEDPVPMSDSHCMAPFSQLPSEETTQSNLSPPLAKAVSDCSLPDDNSTTDANNLDVSIEDDSQSGDMIPVVGDAQEMHEAFMQYLNCSTWSTQMDEIDKFESMVAENNPKDPVLMYPSVSVELFEEFIRRNPDEAREFRRKITFKLKKIKETENKQQQAHEKRLQLLQSKTEKVRGFVQKVRDVQIAQDKLAQKRKHQIDEKLRKAEENRKNYLSSIRRKAHDEEEKLKEIAFINELEAQNRRHDSLALRQEHEERLQYIIDERQRKVEEKAAKEAAVEERRRVLEVERQQKLLKIAEARRKKEETIDRKQQERETQRLVTAREKAREREERLSALNAAKKATAEELQKRIQQKQEDSARRHEENIESIRQRALEVGLHRNSDDADELGNPETEQSVDRSKEKLKAQKRKRCRKLRSRMIARATEFLREYAPLTDETELVFPFSAPLRELQKKRVSGKLTDLLKSVCDLTDVIVNGNNSIYKDFTKSRGFVCLIDIGKELLNKHPSTLVSEQIFILNLLLGLFKNFLYNSDHLKYFVMSNDIMFLVDLLRFSLMGLDITTPDWSSFSENLINLLADALQGVSLIDETEKVFPGINCQMADVISYILNSGMVERIISLFQDSVIDDNRPHMKIIPNCVKLFTTMISPRFKNAELMNTLVVTDCLGTIPLLYEGLQKMTGSEVQPLYFSPIIDLLLKFAELDVLLFQDTLGADGMALQVRAIASNLINYCKNKPLEELLRAIILLVGYFAMKNVKNQTLLQSGHQPTVLQQLVTLPFIYFCDAHYADSLFPTLLACSYNNPTNKAIVENELSFSRLEGYVSSERGKKNRMVQLFNSLTDRS